MIPCTTVQKKITIQQSGSEIIVIVEHGGLLDKDYQLTGGDWDGLKMFLLGEGCVERQILEALEILETQNTVTIIATAER